MSRLDIHIIGSSSKGNCIVISDGTSSLMLDAGLSFDKINRHADLSAVEGVLVTHHHLDHCRALPEMIRRGMTGYMSWMEWREMRMDAPEHGMYFAQDGVQIDLESWLILPFSVDHDTPDALGFLIYSKRTKKKIVYAVDMPSINYDFTGVTHWILEANYSHEILERSNYEEFVKNRIMRSHMSIESLIAFLKSSDLRKAEGIWLCHLSDANSDEAAFIEQIQQATGVPVYAAGDRL